MGQILLTPEEIKATSPTAPWYVGCEQCAQRIAKAQLKKVVEWLKLHEQGIDELGVPILRLPPDEWRTLPKEAGLEE